MDQLTRALSVYRELAEQYDRIGKFSMRDCFLIMAADAARSCGDGAEAERLRNRLLQVSRHHMLRAYASFDEAARVPDVESYLRDLRTTYPLAVAEQMLEELRTPIGPRPTALLPGQADRPIPPTSPLLDLNSGPRARHDPYPLDEGPPVHRPLAQPRPGRGPMPAAHAPLPLPDQVPEPLTANRPDVPAAEEGTSTGAWFSALLGGVVLIAGLAWMCFTLVRPFLPAEWGL